MGRRWYTWGYDSKKECIGGEVLNQAALNFVMLVLPNLPKIPKSKNKTKGKNRVKHRAHTIFTHCELDSFRGGKERLIDRGWEQLYNMFKKKGITPSHYERYESKFGIHLRLETIEEVDDWELENMEHTWG